MHWAQLQYLSNYLEPNCSSCEKLVPKNQNFCKMKKNPDIHPRNKCAKFQPNRSIFEAFRLWQSFSLVLVKNSSPSPKNQNFWVWIFVVSMSRNTQIIGIKQI